MLIKLTAVLSLHSQEYFDFWTRNLYKYINGPNHSIVPEGGGGRVRIGSAFIHILYIRGIVCRLRKHREMLFLSGLARRRTGGENHHYQPTTSHSRTHTHTQVGRKPPEKKASVSSITSIDITCFSSFPTAYQYPQTSPSPPRLAGII